MVDVVPELYESITKDFKNYTMKDRRIANISKRIRDGTATQRDAHDYAERLGENLSRSLVNNLTPERLPDGRLYYNIAKRTVVPSLENNYELTNDVASEIQAALDLKAGIGLNSAKADFPNERIQGLIDKMTADGITFDNVIIWLQEPIVNNTEAFFDDFIKENAKVRHDVGLKATITRSVANGCCAWCDALAGVYEYGQEPEDIYRRHEFCRCTVTFQSKKTSQNVWTKNTWQSSPEELDRRKEVGGTPSMTKAEQLSRQAQIARDIELQEFQRQTGYSRATARRATVNKTPEQIQAEIKKIQERQERLARR